MRFRRLDRYEFSDTARRRAAMLRHLHADDRLDATHECRPTLA